MVPPIDRTEGACALAYIYALRDPRDGRIRYIGKTVYPNRRIRQHCSLRERNSYKNRWLAQLIAEGLAPVLQILEACPLECWKERERYWERVARENGEPLTNLAECGWGVTVVTEEARRNKSEAIRRAFANGANHGGGRPHWWEGFVDPAGVPIPPIRNLNAFCSERGLSRQNMRAVYRGDVRECQGWTNARPEAQARRREIEQRAEANRFQPGHERGKATRFPAKVYEGLVDPRGFDVGPIANLPAFCRERGLCIESIRGLFTGRFRRYQGYFCPRS